MHPLDPVPAIRRIETDRPDAHAFEMTGRMTAADVENLYGLLEGAYALSERIDLLVLITDLEGVDWDISRDTARETRHHAHDHIRRCAMVGRDAAIRDVRSFFAPPAPVECRDFGNEEEAEAWEWIGARPAASSP